MQRGTVIGTHADAAYLDGWLSACREMALRWGVEVQDSNRHTVTEAEDEVGTPEARGRTNG